MRTSLNDIQQAEKFLSGNLLPKDALLFKAKLLMDPLLRLNMYMQEKTYLLIRLYGRKKLKSEIECVHEKFFHDPQKTTFRQKIVQLFPKS